jgi:hypothetical protein
MTAATLECPHGLTSDLHLDGNKLSAFVSWLIFHASTALLVKSPVALVVFHVPYTLVDVPSKWIVKEFRYGIYLPLLIICSGLVSTFLVFTKSYAGLIFVRCLLGLFEGGLLGGEWWCILQCSNRDTPC